MTAPVPAPRRLWGVALAAFCLRGAYLLAVGPAPAGYIAPDSVDYLQAARNLRVHGAFSLSPAPPLVPDTVRTPGYPFFLALFTDASGTDAAAAAWTQAALAGVASALLYAAALLLWRREDAALAAALGLAADAAGVFHAGLLLTETLFSSCVCLVLFCLARAWRAERRGLFWWAAAGLSCGAAALVRPVGLYLFVFAAGASALALARARRPAARAVLALSAAALLLPGLWTLRNRARTGVWTFSSIQGMNFFGMRSAAVEMELSGVGYDEALLRVRAKLAAETAPGPATAEETARRQGRFAARFLLSHPAAYLTVMAKDAAKLLGGHAMDIPAWTLLKDPAFDPKVPKTPPARRGPLSGTRDLLASHPGLGLAIALYWAFLGAAYLLAARGLRRALSKGELSESALAAFPAAYFLLVSAGALAYYRLRLPLMPAVFLLAGRGLRGR